MSESDHNTQQTIGASSAGERPDPQPDNVGVTSSPAREFGNDTRGWWIKLFAAPALLLACGAILIAGLGLAQRLGFISAGGGGEHVHADAANEDVLYICPMMCTPPQSQPGRCPVCGMELVPTTSDHGDSDPHAIHIDPAARRVANIHTVAVRATPVNRTIRAIGELSYDEGKLKTISAYVDGRLERLYADYTGVVVQKGDDLAILYSPRLYSSQVELLSAKKARDDSRSATLPQVMQSRRDLYDNARRRLIELGMTEEQVEQLERTGEANSRLELRAPISGTVIEKLAVEGQYVKQGDAIYKLADLTTIWLKLRLFPEEAATVRYGQKVEAQVQSLPGRTFTGRIAFIDPNVDPETRTVGVRVVVPNDEGLLRVGDYAKASVQVPAGAAGEGLAKIYEPELADRWISPRHPHVIESAPGTCRECGVDLVPSAKFGFTNEPTVSGRALVVPRDAVLMAGSNSIVYVEAAPGRFEIRRVVLGPSTADGIVILSGLEEGEHVATRGNFLIDSQMQLAGNPSLIDPLKLGPQSTEPLTEEMTLALSKLTAEDRETARIQQICPVTEMRLGSMGTPLKVDVNGTPVFICCDGCRKSLLDDPQRYMENLAGRHASDASPESEPEIGLPPVGPMQLMDRPESPQSTNAVEPLRTAGNRDEYPPSGSLRQAGLRGEGLQ